MANTPELNLRNLGANKVINGGGNFWQRLPSGCGTSRSHTLTASNTFVGATATTPFIDIGTTVIGPGITGVATVTNVNRNTGDIVISQTVTGSGTYYFGIANTSKYVADRFKLASTLTANMMYFSPSNNPVGAGASMRVTSPTAVTVGASDRVYIPYTFEGYDTLDFLTKRFNLTFYVRASTAGTYSVRLTDQSTRNYFIPYTISAANTWEKKTIKLPTIRVGDSYNYINGAGLTMVFCLVAGSSTLATTNYSWDETATGGVVGQANPFAIAGNTFDIANVYVGESEEYQLAGGTIGGELSLCQRYYEKTYNVGIIPGTVTDNGSIFSVSSGTSIGTLQTLYKFGSTKRTSSYAVTSFNPATSVFGSFNRSGTPIASLVISQSDSLVGFRNDAVTTDNGAHNIHAAVDAEL
jgi:hypothetical protein